MRTSILGVKIDDVSLEEATKIVEGWLGGRGKHYIVTPNPEFIMVAQKDPAFKKILNNADLSIPDGAGLKLSGEVKNTTAGIDLMERLVALSAEKAFKIGLLGGRKGIAEKAAECLRQRYQNISIVFAKSGGEVDKEGKLLKYHKSLKLLNLLNCDLLFVAFGQVKQEKWIAINLDKIQVKVAMGVGGAFDYISGKVTRAPTLVRNLGLEWLFRLICQPWRIKRQVTLLQFIWKVMLH